MSKSLPGRIVFAVAITAAICFLSNLSSAQLPPCDGTEPAPSDLCVAPYLCKLDENNCAPAPWNCNTAPYTLVASTGRFWCKAGTNMRSLCGDSGVQSACFTQYPCVLNAEGFCITAYAYPCYSMKKSTVTLVPCAAPANP